MRLALMLAAALSAAAPDPLEFVDPEAEAHWSRAQDAFARKDYATAQEETAAAFRLEPNPRLQLAWAQAARLAGNWTKAAELYEAFVQSGPAQAPAAFATEHALYCRARAAEDEQRCADADQLYSQLLRDYPDGILAEQAIDHVGQCEPPPPDPAPAGTTEPKPAASPPPTPVTTPPPTPPPPRPWHRDPAGGLSLGFGVAGVAAGAGLMVAAAVDYDRAPLSADHAAARRREGRAITMQTAGVVVISVGAALVVTAIVRYALVARRNRTTRTATPRPRRALTAR